MTQKIFNDNDWARLEHLAKIIRGLIFSTVEIAQSGHPGGSSSKVEQLLTLLFGGHLAFDPTNPKNPGRDRLVWSAGHCTPLLFSINSLIYECLRRNGRQFSEAVVKPIFPEDLLRFRRVDGPQGHVESSYPLSDYGTGPSGHGFSAGGGMAIAHRACGLPTKIWILMGDAESEEGITFEARNILKAVGAKNLIVSLDYNHFGIDGPIEEVMSTEYTNQWKTFGWNVLECNGHDMRAIHQAYSQAENLHNDSPTVVICHTIKGKDYGEWENSQNSHGSPIAHDQYITIMKKLGFEIADYKNEPFKYVSAVLKQLTVEDENFICAEIEQAAKKIPSEVALMEKVQAALKNRPLRDYTTISRPKKIPTELTFAIGEKTSTRKAGQKFWQWLMKQTAFCFVGSGDVSRSMLTNKAEETYGYVNKDNPIGRGIRFGIAEQNMAMMSAGLTHDILPGGFKPMSIFGSFAVFSSIMSNCIRLALINNHLNPELKSFFIMIAGHDGPETGEDGPTHQGLYWMSYFHALPGIKVYKPLDANETVEMIFHAIKIGEPIALSLYRPDLPIIDRSLYGKSKPSDAVNGAYVFKPYKKNGLPKKVLVISGAIILQNILTILPDLEQQFDIKIVVVTAPKLFSDLKINEPKKAKKIFSDKEKKYATTIHNGWKGFLDEFLLSADASTKRMGVNNYLKSGNIEELYATANLASVDIKNKLLQNI